MSSAEKLDLQNRIWGDAGEAREVASLETAEQSWLLCEMFSDMPNAYFPGEGEMHMVAKRVQANDRDPGRSPNGPGMSDPS